MNKMKILASVTIVAFVLGVVAFLCGFFVYPEILSGVSIVCISTFSAVCFSLSAVGLVMVAIAKYRREKQYLTRIIGLQGFAIFYLVLPFKGILFISCFPRNADERILYSSVSNSFAFAMVLGGAMFLTMCIAQGIKEFKVKKIWDGLISFFGGLTVFLFLFLFCALNFSALQFSTILFLKIAAVFALITIGIVIVREVFENFSS